MLRNCLNRLYYVLKKLLLAERCQSLGAGVAQPGWSVRLIIERSRARIPPPAPFTSIISYAGMLRGVRFGRYEVNLLATFAILN